MGFFSVDSVHREASGCIARTHFSLNRACSQLNCCYPHTGALVPQSTLGGSMEPTMLEALKAALFIAVVLQGESLFIPLSSEFHYWHFPLRRGKFTACFDNCHPLLRLVSSGGKENEQLHLAGNVEQVQNIRETVFHPLSFVLEVLVKQDSQQSQFNRETSSKAEKHYNQNCRTHGMPTAYCQALKQCGIFILFPCNTGWGRFNDPAQRCKALLLTHSDVRPGGPH